MSEASRPREQLDPFGGTLHDPRLVTPSLLRQWALPQPDGSKYSRGQVLVIGGGRGTPGAAMLAARAALRLGAGRLTLAVAASVAAHVAVAVPESGVIGLHENAKGISGEDAETQLADELERADALLLGPGLDSPAGTARLLAAVVSQTPDDVPVLLDAFGATTLPELDPELQDRLRGRLVLTPNEGELARLLEVDEVDSLPEATVTASERFGAAVGCDQWMVWEGNVWQASSGDTGLGTSGSGDVAAGAVLGLLGRGADPAQALVWGKHVHAAAGDVLAAQHGRVGYLASEIEPELPRILRTLNGD